MGRKNEFLFLGVVSSKMHYFVCKRIVMNKSSEKYWKFWKIEFFSENLPIYAKCQIE